MGLLDDAIREHLDLKRRRGADPAEVERLEREALGPVRRGGFDHDEDVLQGDYPPEGAHDLDLTEPAYAGEVAETAHPADAEPDWVEGEKDQPPIDEAPEYEPPFEEPTAGAGTHVAPPADAEPPAPAEPVPPAAGTEASTALPRHHEILEDWDNHEALHGPAQPAAPEQGAPAEGEAGHPEERAHAFEEETAEYDVEAAHEDDEAAAHEDDEAAAHEDDEAAAHEDDEAADDVLKETPDFLQDTPDHDRLWFEQRPPRDFDFGS